MTPHIRLYTGRLIPTPPRRPRRPSLTALRAAGKAIIIRESGTWVAVPWPRKEEQ